MDGPLIAIFVAFGILGLGYSLSKIMKRMGHGHRDLSD